MSEPLVLKNANVITMVKAVTPTRALALENGRIVRVGLDREMNDLIDQGWPSLDLGGRTVLPGFIDCHAHLMLTGLISTGLALVDATSVDQILERLATAARETEEGIWIAGGGLNEQNIQEKRLPTRTELDLVCPRHPVYLLHATCHLCVFNTRALSLIGLPPGLEGVDMEGGRPTGVVRDPGILTHVHPIMARLIPPAVRVAALEVAARKALAAGVTTVHALDGGDLGPGDTRIIMDHRDRLPLRVICYNQSMDLSEVRELGLPRVGGCICADGAFEAHTAALFEPYADDPDNYGALTFTQERMDAFILEAHQAGLQIAVHCESEGSIEQVLRAMEKALRVCPRTDHRHRIEHFELPTPRQIERLAVAGIMASMQPAFIPAFIGLPDMPYYRRLLGPARLRWVHPYRTILTHGVPICGGSDTPVTPFGPLAGIQAALEHPWETERITRAEALAMFTTTAARAAFEESDKGTLEPGKLADLVILSASPEDVPIAEISKIKVEAAYVGGMRREIT